MTGLVDICLVEIMPIDTVSGVVDHQCFSDYVPFIGEFEAQVLERYDSELLKKLTDRGTRIVKVTSDDFDRVGDLIDELQSKLKYTINYSEKFPYKHSICRRLNYELISTVNSIYRKRNVDASIVFGNSLKEY